MGKRAARDGFQVSLKERTALDRDRSSNAPEDEEGVDEPDFSHI
jgi:hypothetical protein